MAKVSQILGNKGGQVMSIGPDVSVLDASLVMNEHRIGALVVLEVGKIVGIISERDVLRRVVAERRDPEATRVQEVMTQKVVTCQADTPLEDARKLFQSRRIRHLPVVDAGGGLEGMISIGDLNAWQLSGQEIEIRHLHEYLYGVAS